jgi:hypothetical protein
MRTVLVLVVIVCAGCASYLTPGGSARLDQVNRTDVAEAASRQPTLKLPARLAILRVQARDYRSYSTEGYGRGALTALTTQDLLTEGQLEATSKWPSVAGMAPVTRLMLPASFDSIDDLRVAGAKIQADVLLVYTVDTAFRVRGRGYGPLAVISLGLVPDRDAYITSTASALLVDVRTGFIYGAAEATQKQSGLTNVWNSRSTIDRKRMEAETQAVTLLMEQTAKTWSGIVRQYQ